jgi:hypothetical protein
LPKPRGEAWRATANRLPAFNRNAPAERALDTPMLQLAIENLCLLASRQDLHRVWGRFDNQRPAEDSSQLLIVLGMAAVAAAALLIWFLAARRPPRLFVSNSPARLFRELCHAHGLSFSTRRLLKRLAAAQGLATPAILFVEPKHFDTANLPPDLQSAAKDVQRIRAHLFGT